jgi:hypothetical protein
MPENPTDFSFLGAKREFSSAFQNYFWCRPVLRPDWHDQEFL